MGGRMPGAEYSVGLAVRLGITYSPPVEGRVKRGVVKPGGAEVNSPLVEGRVKRGVVCAAGRRITNRQAGQLS